MMQWWLHCIITLNALDFKANYAKVVEGTGTPIVSVTKSRFGSI